ncbi:MAG: DUF2807 domain-containing protein [Pseudomonadota bacterium]|nr:DUF2807 domain-containing protein [Pseudomonadota bacterium]
MFVEDNSRSSKYNGQQMEMRYICSVIERIVMRMKAKLVTLAAALLVSAATLLPTSGIAAQDWHRVGVNRTPEVVGNGQVVTQQRPVGAFRDISLNGSGDLIVRIGPERSLSVTADSNVLPLLGQRIKDGKLILEPRHSYRTRTRPRYVVTVPALDSVGIGGSGHAEVDGVVSDRFALAIGGSGSIVAKGRARQLSLAIGGSGDIDARALRASSVAVTIGGSGSARVATNGPLSGTIAGSGSIRYLGRPSAIAVTRVGAGTVAPLR